MGSYTAPAGGFTGGTVASATTFSSLVTASGGFLETWSVTSAIPVVTQTATISPASSQTMYRRSRYAGADATFYIVDFICGFAVNGNGTATGPIIIDIATIITAMAGGAGYIMGTTYARSMTGSFAGKPSLVVSTGDSTLAPQTAAGVNLGATQTLATSDQVSITGRLHINLD